MAHNLTIQSGRILYAQRADLPAPWWAGMIRDNGKQAGETLNFATFAPDATIDEVRAAAGLEWDAVAAAIRYSHPADPAIMLTSTDSALIVRSDTGEELGRVSTGYQVHTMAEVFAIFAGMLEGRNGGGWQMGTVMALKGGRLIVGQADRGEFAEVVPGDPIARKVMLQTSFDGSVPTGACDSETRVVCDNTRRMAWGDSAAKRAVQRHRSKLNGAALMKRAGIRTGAESDAWAENIAMLHMLADAPVSADEARELITRILTGKVPSKPAEPSKPAPAVSGAVDLSGLLAQPFKPRADDDVQRIGRIAGETKDREPRAVEPIIALFNGQGKGSTLPGVSGTRYGILQAVTEYTDHHAGRSWDTGKTSALFGQNANVKARAVEILADLPQREMIATF